MDTRECRLGPTTAIKTGPRALHGTAACPLALRMTRRATVITFRRGRVAWSLTGPDSADRSADRSTSTRVSRAVATHATGMTRRAISSSSSLFRASFVAGMILRRLRESVCMCVCSFLVIRTARAQDLTLLRVPHRQVGRSARQRVRTTCPYRCSAPRSAATYPLLFLSLSRTIAHRARRLVSLILVSPAVDRRSHEGTCPRFR